MICLSTASPNMRDKFQKACRAAVINRRPIPPLMAYILNPKTKYSPKPTRWFCGPFLSAIAKKVACLTTTKVSTPTPSVSPLPTELKSLPLGPPPAPPTSASRQVDWDYYAMYELFAALGSVLVKVEALPISGTPGSLSPLVTPEPIDDDFDPLEDRQVHLKKGYEGNPSQQSESAETGFRTVWMNETGQIVSDDGVRVFTLSRAAYHAGHASTINLHTKKDFFLKEFKKKLAENFFTRVTVQNVYSKHHAISKQRSKLFRLELYRKK